MSPDLPPARRELETCLNRLEMRGLIARGVGDTNFELITLIIFSPWVVFGLLRGFPLSVITVYHKCRLMPIDFPEKVMKSCHFGHIHISFQHFCTSCT